MFLICALKMINFILEEVNKFAVEQNSNCGCSNLIQEYKSAVALPKMSY